MNVASLNNCKRLYELSGWETELSNSRPCYVINQVLDEDSGLKTPSKLSLVGFGKKSGAITYFPAYDAGYLLRKLPKEYNMCPLKLTFRNTNWHVEYSAIFGAYQEQTYFNSCADTPEDALALLAIKLIEEGILQPTAGGKS